MDRHSPFRSNCAAAGFIARGFAILLALVLAGEAQAISFTTVVIDAGHGGADGGAVWNGLIERNLTLDVAKRLDAVLRARGVRTVMTRKTNSTVELESRSRTANRHRSSVFVSIHFNASRDRSVSGIETHYLSARGRELAGHVQRSLDKRITGINRGVSRRDYKVLRETKMPAVLVECGFISNKKEAARCASSAHRQKLAEAIASGILAARR
jgi:N-acetylmuramoyl-L-alanine amidase